MNRKLQISVLAFMAVFGFSSVFAAEKEKRMATTFQPSKEAAAEVPKALTAPTEYAGAKTGLAIRLEGHNLFAGKTLVGTVLDSLAVGTPGPWEKRKDSASKHVWTKSAAGLTWEKTLTIDSNNCLSIKHTISVSKEAKFPVSLYGYDFSIKEGGEVEFDTVCVPRTHAWLFDRKYQNFRISDFVPYAIFDDRKTGMRLGCYVPNWLDFAGNFEVFSYGSHPAHIERDGRLFKLRLGFNALNFASVAKQTPTTDMNAEFSRKASREWEYEIIERDWHIADRKIKPGESLSFEIRLAAFDGREEKRLGREDPPEKFGPRGVASSRLERGELLCLGYPLPMEQTAKTGHFWAVPWNEIDKDLKLLDSLAAAGTKAIVFRSPDFQDISHGVSWNGSYDSAPPNIMAVLNRTHELGMKALWWCSIKGFLRPGVKRNNGLGDPLLKEHPEWALPGYYWNNMYQHADMDSNGWKNWLIEKVKRDMSKYPLDGWALDEPYFLGSLVNDQGQTRARSVYDFLGRLKKTIRSFGDDKLLIANNPWVLHDEWKQFDYIMMETYKMGWTNNVMMGRSPGSWPNGRFSFAAILNLIAQNFAIDNQVLGWHLPNWILSLFRDKNVAKRKTPEDISRLLALVGKGNRIWAGEIAPGLRQIESRMSGGKHVIILCNTSSKVVQSSLVGLHKIPAGKYAIKATLDTKGATETRKLVWDTANDPSLKITNIPAESVIALYLEGSSRRRLVAVRRDSIKLDGDLSDWDGIDFVPVTLENGVSDVEDSQGSIADNSADLSYKFAVCHDDEALYVAVEVVDDVVVTDDNKPGRNCFNASRDDSMEVFIDGNRNRAPNARIKNGEEYAFGGEFGIGINGSSTSNCSGWPDTFGQKEYWQGATNWAEVQKGAKVLRYEFRLTWKVMGGKIRPGDTIGFTIGAQDDDNGDGRDHGLYWSAIAPHCWKDENGWGDVYLQPGK